MGLIPPPGLDLTDPQGTPSIGQSSGAEAQDDGEADVHSYFLFHASDAELEEVRARLDSKQQYFEGCKVAVHQWEDTTREGNEADVERIALRHRCSAFVDRRAIQEDRFPITQLSGDGKSIRTKGRLAAAGVVPAVVNVDLANMDLWEYLTGSMYPAELDFNHDENDSSGESGEGDDEAEADHQTAGPSRGPELMEQDDSADVHAFFLFHASESQLDDVRTRLKSNDADFDYCTVAVYQWEDQNREGDKSDVERIALERPCCVFVDRRALEDDRFLITEKSPRRERIITQGRIAAAGVLPAVINVDLGNMFLHEFLGGELYPAELDFSIEEDEAEERQDGGS